MKKWISILIICSATMAFIVDGFNWKIAPTTKANFIISGPLGINVKGTIDVLKADIDFNPDDIIKASLSAKMRVNTINTNNRTRDNHLKTVDYFDAANYPEIVFKSIVITKQNTGKFIATGNLSIKQITKKVEIPFTFKQQNNTATFEGSFTIKRVDYGIGNKSMMMGNEVTINLNIVATK